MWNFARATVALAAAALTAFAGAALAADAVKLQIEAPRDARNVEAGDPGIDIQIIGIDAAGQRVGFGDKKLETSVTDGDLVSVEGSYKFRYVPPSAPPAAGATVKISAWLKQSPEVRGELSLPLVPHRPYERLVLVAGNTAVELGTSIEIEVRGVRADGSTVLVKDAPVTMVPDPSVGRIENVAQGVYRFNAPAKTDAKMVGAAAHLKAFLERYPQVAGDLTLVMSAQAPPPAPGGVSTGGVSSAVASATA